MPTDSLQVKVPRMSVEVRSGSTEQVSIMSNVLEHNFLTGSSLEDAVIAQLRFPSNQIPLGTRSLLHLSPVTGSRKTTNV